MAGLGPFGDIYAPPGVYPTTIIAEDSAAASRGTRVPVIIGTGAEQLLVSNEEVFRGSSSQADNPVYNEDLSSQITGTTNQFQLSNYPVSDGTGRGHVSTDPNSVTVLLNGEKVQVLQLIGSTGKIFLSSLPLIGDTLTATYFYNRTDTHILSESLDEQVDGINTTFKVKNIPVVTGDNSGTTTNDPSDIIVYVHGVQVVPISLDGSTGVFVLPYAPSILPSVPPPIRVTYYTNIWQNTFDRLHYSMTENSYFLPTVGRVAGREDFVNTTDYVIHGNLIFWGTTGFVEADTENTAPATVPFDDAYISITQYDNRRYMEFVGTGDGSNTIFNTIYTFTDGGGIDRPTEDPQFVRVYIGDDVSSAYLAGPVTVKEIISASKQIELVSAPADGKLVFVTYYYNITVDDKFEITVATIGVPGVGTFTVKSTFDLDDAVEFVQGVHSVSDSNFVVAGGIVFPNSTSDVQGIPGISKDETIRLSFVNSSTYIVSSDRTALQDYRTGGITQGSGFAVGSVGSGNGVVRSTSKLSDDLYNSAVITFASGAGLNVTHTGSLEWEVELVSGVTTALAVKNALNAETSYSDLFHATNGSGTGGNVVTIPIGPLTHSGSAGNGHAFSYATIGSGSTELTSIANYPGSLYNGAVIKINTGTSGASVTYDGGYTWSLTLASSGTSVNSAIALLNADSDFKSLFLATTSGSGAGLLSDGVMIHAYGTPYSGQLGQTYIDPLTGVRFTVMSGTLATPTYYYSGGDYLKFISNSAITCRAAAFLGIPGFKYYIPQTVGTAVGNAALFYTFDGAGNEPDVGEFYYVSYYYDKPDSDFDTMSTWSDLSKVIQNFGSYSLENPVVIAFDLCQRNGSDIVGIKQVRKAPNSNQATDTSYINALRDLEKRQPGNPNIKGIIPLKYSDTIVSELKKHCEKMSSQRYKMNRRGYVGVSLGITPNQVKGIAEGLHTERFDCVYPDGGVIPITDNLGNQVEVAVDGTMLAAAFSGLDLSPQFDVAVSMSYRQIVGFSRLIRTLDEIEMNNIAISGVTLLESVDPIIRVRQDFTTNMDTVLYQQPSVWKIADYIEEGADDTLKPFIGAKGLPKLLGDVEEAYAKFLKLMQDREIITAYRDIKIEYDSSDPRILIVSAEYSPVLPVLWIPVTNRIRVRLV